MALEWAGDGEASDSADWVCLRRARLPEGLASVGDGGGEISEVEGLSRKGSKLLVEIMETSACEGVWFDGDCATVVIGGEGWRPCFPRMDELEALLSRMSA
jgi:hypothetical protein